MNLFAKIGLPDLVNLNQALLDFLGPLAPLVVTLLNGMAFLLIMLLVARLSIIAIKAILEFNKDTGMVGQSTSGLLIASIRSGVEAFLIALVGFLVIAQGPNLLYFLAQSTASSLIVQDTDYLPRFAGPFAGLVASAQTAVSLGVIVIAVFLAGKLWWNALNGAGLGADSHGVEGNAGQMGLLNNAAKRTAILAVMAIAAFVTVRYGPQLFFEIIQGGGGLVNTPLLP